MNGVILDCSLSSIVIKSLLSSLSISMLDVCNSVRISCSSCSSCAHLSLCSFRALSCAGFTHFFLALQECKSCWLIRHTGHRYLLPGEEGNPGIARIPYSETVPVVVARCLLSQSQKYLRELHFASDFTCLYSST